ncbi:hypothetical protein [Pseudescherichia sp.]|uniref:hypothetical protein n=1 Tax=Pseudescherichia sp. TaxID=2055881 RepID=UPI0028B0A39C|nr:hypothetical protein [Pseudescherichia sp.]
MKYSVGAKVFVFLWITITVFFVWLLFAPPLPASRWPMSSNEFTCAEVDPVQVHSLYELDRKINKIAVSPGARRPVLCVTRPQVGEWDIYTNPGSDLTMQQNY